MHACLPLTIAALKHARNIAFASTPFAAGLHDAVAPMGDVPAVVSRDVDFVNRLGKISHVR